HDETVAGNSDVDVFQVVLTRTADGDLAGVAGKLAVVIGHSISFGLRTGSRFLSTQANTHRRPGKMRGRSGLRSTDVGRRLTLCQPEHQTRPRIAVENRCKRD